MCAFIGTCVLFSCLAPFSFNLLFLSPPLPSSLFLQNVLPQLRRYDTAQPNLAADVKAYLSSAATATSMLTNKSKADRKSLVEMITNYQLMAGLVNLFEIDPMLAFTAPPLVYICTSELKIIMWNIGMA